MLVTSNNCTPSHEQLMTDDPKVVHFGKNSIIPGMIFPPPKIRNEFSPAACDPAPEGVLDDSFALLIIVIAPESHGHLGVGHGVLA